LLLLFVTLQPYQEKSYMNYPLLSQLGLGFMDKSSIC
jgi:hypothetical protein